MKKTLINTSDDIYKLIEKFGKDRIKFRVEMNPLRSFLFFAYKSSSDPLIPVMCGIDESRYKLNDKYKITLKSENERFGSESYYVTDLAQLIQSGNIRIFVEY